jgi:hypothetical protein
MIKEEIKLPLGLLRLFSKGYDIIELDIGVIQKIYLGGESRYDNCHAE